MKKILTRGNAVWFLLSAILVISNGCSGGGGGGGTTAESGPAATGDFPVNEPLAAALMSKGVPADIAQYFAAVKLESSCSTSATCTYRQTYPNGAMREITVSAGTNTPYAPTADELAGTASINSPVYDNGYSASGVEDITTQLTLSYFVPTSSIPRSPAAAARGTRRGVLIQHAPGAADGFTINWEESGKTGADVSIGSVLDYYGKTGSAVKATGTVYAVASAASNISDAADVSVQTRAWMAELDALENCAANPTNPLARTDPNYSAAAVAKVRSVRAELKANSAVRFLNVMDETAAGLNPVLSVLSIPLKQVYLWNEQTLNDVTEAAMREARLAVVSCVDVGWNGKIISSVTGSYSNTESGPTAVGTYSITKKAAYNEQWTFEIDPTGHFTDVSWQDLTSIVIPPGTIPPGTVLPTESPRILTLPATATLVATASYEYTSIGSDECGGEGGIQYNGTHEWNDSDSYAVTKNATFPASAIVSVYSDGHYELTAVTLSAGTPVMTGTESATSTSISHPGSVSSCGGGSSSQTIQKEIATSTGRAEKIPGAWNEANAPGQTGSVNPNLVTLFFGSSPAVNLTKTLQGAPGYPSIAVPIASTVIWNFKK